MHYNDLDSILEKIAFSFGKEAIDIIIPDDMLINLSLICISGIDINYLDYELVYQSKLYGLFSSLLSSVYSKNDELDSEFKVLEARLFTEFKAPIAITDEKGKVTEKKPTDKEAESLVLTDKRTEEKRNELLKFDGFVRTFSNILKSLDKRQDMLVNLAAKKKAEINKGM